MCVKLPGESKTNQLMIHVASGALFREISVEMTEVFPILDINVIKKLFLYSRSMV